MDARNNNGDTPLHLASKGGQLEPVRTLLEANCDPNLKNELSFTPLELAFLNGLEKVFKFLQNRTNEKPRSLEELQSIGAVDGKLLDKAAAIENLESSRVIKSSSSPKRESMSVVVEEDTKVKKFSSNKVSDDQSDISKTVCEEDKI